MEEKEMDERNSAKGKEGRRRGVRVALALERVALPFRRKVGS